VAFALQGYQGCLAKEPLAQLGNKHADERRVRLDDDVLEE
jgi:hypothetical protein